MGQGYLPPSFTFKLRDKQEYLHGTYAEKVFIPTENFRGSFEAEMPPPLYELGSAGNTLASYEGRLIAQKVLITKTKAKIEVERTDRTNDILFGYQTVGSLKAEKKRLSQESRASFEGALSANTAFSRLLARKATRGDEEELMKDKAFHTILTGAKEFTLKHAEWIDRGMVSDTYSIRDILKCEDMYLRSEVSTEEDMKVSGISRVWERNGKEVMTETKTEVGLWKSTPSVYEWAHRVGNILSAERDNYGPTLPRNLVATIFYENREHVADDPLVVAKVLDYANKPDLLITDVGCIVTQDRNLCRAAASKSGRAIARLSTYGVVKILKNLNNIQEDTIALEGDKTGYISQISRKMKIRIGFTIVDTGSVDEMLMRHDFTDIGEGGQKPYSFNTSSFFTRKGKRHEILTYTPIKVEVKTLDDLRSFRDPNGHPMFEIFKPHELESRKLPNFESYAKGSSVSSKTTTHSTKRESRKKDRRKAMSERL